MLLLPLITGLLSRPSTPIQIQVHGAEPARFRHNLLADDEVLANMAFIVAVHGSAMCIYHALVIDSEESALAGESNPGLFRAFSSRSQSLLSVSCSIEPFACRQACGSHELRLPSKIVI